MSAEFPNNTTDYIGTSADTDFDIAGQDFTMMMWVIFDATPPAQDGWLMLRRGTGAVANNEWFFRPILHSGLGNFFRLNFEINNVANIVGSSTLSINTWYHICLTRKISTNTYTFYINGVSDGATVNSGTIVDKASSGLSLCKGGNYGGGYSLDGKVAHLKMWNQTCLTAAEIVNEMNKFTVEKTGGCRINLPLDLISGTTADNNMQDTSIGTWGGTQRWFQSPAVTGALE